MPMYVDDDQPMSICDLPRNDVLSLETMNNETTNIMCQHFVTMIHLRFVTIDTYNEAAMASYTKKCVIFS